MNHSSGSSAPTSVVLRVGEHYATVSGPSSRLDEIRRLFVDELVPPEADLEAESAIVSVDIDPDDHIVVDGRLWDPEPGQAFCDQFIYAFMRTALDAEPSLLHLHAGLVAESGRSIVVAGLAGSGKSTLIADLVAGGFDYFSDERVGVDDVLGLTPLRKPISVVSGSFAHLAAVHPGLIAKGAASDRVWHVPASALARPRATGYHSPPPSPGAVIFSQFRPATAPALEAVHPITAARLLLSDALDTDRYGDGAVALAVRLCASVPCWSMVHPGGAVAVGAVRTACTAPPANERIVHLIAPGARPAWVGVIKVGPDSVLGVAARTSGAAVDDRALVRTASGDLVELDEVLTAWLLLLDGRTPVGSLVEEVAAANGLDSAALLGTVTVSLAHLASLGVAA